MKLKIPTACLPAGMAISALLITSTASAQNIYVGAYNYPGTVYEYSPGGSVTTSYSGLGEPEALAFNSSGNLFVANSANGSIEEIMPGGSESTFATVGNASGLAFDNAGDLFVSGYGNGYIYEVSPTGSPSTFATGLSHPGGMAFDSAGDLFVATVSSGDIYEFKNNHGTLSSTGSIFASGLNTPSDLAFDGAGDMFVAEASIGNGDILEYTPGGQKSTYATGFDFPSEIAFDANGNLFVTESDQNEIFKIAPNQTVTDFASLNNCTGIAIQGIILPVPEPSTWALAAVGGVVFLFRGKKCKI